MSALIIPGDREEALRVIARWVFDTCLVFGAMPETAALVAYHFVAGLRREWAE